MLRNLTGAVLTGPTTSPDNRPRSTSSNHFASGSREHPQPNAGTNRRREEQLHLHPINEGVARSDETDGDAAWNDGDSPWNGIGSVDDSDGEEIRPYAREASVSAKPISPNKFPWKLFRVLDNTAYSDICIWCKDGAGFQILDQDRFVKTAMKEICKSEKGDFGTFAKQLNTYGFKKHGRNRRPQKGQSPVRGPSTWRHVDGLFRRGEPHLARRIVSKRGNPLASLTEDTTMQEPDVEVIELRSELQASQTSNEEKDREIEELRRTTEHQAGVIDSLQQMITFLLSLLQLPLSTSPNPPSTDALHIQDPTVQASMSQTNHIAPTALRTPQNADDTIDPSLLSRDSQDELEQHNEVQGPDVADGSRSPFPPVRNDRIAKVREPTPPSEQWDLFAYFGSHSLPSSEP